MQEFPAQPASFWEDARGSWTLASRIVRALLRSEEISAAELYAMLLKLDVADRFSAYWRNKDFYTRADMPLAACRAVGRRSFHTGATLGDEAWKDGDLPLARQLYERCVTEEGDAVTAGLDGIFRLCFATGDFTGAVDAFIRGCPPREFFARRQSQQADSASRADCDAEIGLLREYPNCSPYFIKHTKVMSSVAIAAAVHSGRLNQSLRELMIAYFDLTFLDLEQAQTSIDSEAEVKRLQKRVQPKSEKSGKSGKTLERLAVEGDTERSRSTVAALIQVDIHSARASDGLLQFLNSQDHQNIGDYLESCTVFDAADANALIFRETLSANDVLLKARPLHRLAILRTLEGRFRSFYVDYLEELQEIMQVLEFDLLPSDVLKAIVSLKWWKTQYLIDDTDPALNSGLFSKRIILENRSWLEHELEQEPRFTARRSYSDRASAVATLHEAYVYLRRLYNDAFRSEKWISEARLGETLTAVFGGMKVVRHARPRWLHPQHLDFLIPEAAIAVEFMGIQHYEPVEVFGGDEGFTATVQRDERKRELCSNAGIVLEYVRYDEDIAARASEIYAASRC